MVELLRAGGWDVRLKDGKIVDRGRPALRLKTGPHKNS